MKKIIILSIAFALLAPISTFGQCEYSLNEIDNFTGIKKIETKPATLHRDFNSAISFSFCRYDSSSFIRVNLNFTGLTYSIIEGDKIIIKLGDSIIEIIASKTEIATGYTSLTYYASEADLEKIKSNYITDIRVHLRDSFVSKAIKPKNAEKIKVASNCI